MGYFFIIVVFVVIGFFVAGYIYELHRMINLLKVEKEMERNCAVFTLRLMLCRFYPKKYSELPTYKEMMESNKNLREYLPTTFEAE